MSHATSRDVLGSAPPQAVTDAPPHVERWTRAHAIAMLLATGASIAMHSALPASGVGLVAVGSLIALHNGRYTPAGGFGAANSVTALRVVLIAVLAVVGRSPLGPSAALFVAFIFALDGLDGWIARRTGQASTFGACFDMECDALFVLMCSLVLYLQVRLPALILLPGILRYVYALAMVLLPGGGREAPRSRIGRYSFSVMVISFIASLWPFEPWHRLLALGATLFIAYSFGRSFYWSQRSV